MLRELYPQGPVAFGIVAAAIGLCFYLAYRAIRYSVRTTGQFVEWVLDDLKRRVVLGYVTGGLMIVTGATTAGYGVSRLNTRTEEEKRTPNRERFYGDMASHIRTGTDKAAIEQLVVNYEKGRLTTPDPVVDLPVGNPGPYGTPLVFGGIAAMIMGIALLVRANNDDG